MSLSPLAYRSVHDAPVLKTLSYSAGVCGRRFLIDVYFYNIRRLKRVWLVDGTMLCWTLYNAPVVNASYALFIGFVG